MPDCGDCCDCGKRAWAQYHADLAAWEAICREMAAEEAAARAAMAPGCCALTAYWVQQACGLVFEVPCRLTYHSICVCGTVTCCFCAPCGDGERAVLHHHEQMVSHYAHLIRLLVFNLLDPCAPIYLYHPDVSLERPPKPRPPCGCCGPQECVCDDCDPRSCASLLERHLRSLLCVFSGPHACHPAPCCGPCPCCRWEDRGPPQVLRQLSVLQAARCAPGCGGCVCESDLGRHMRWAAEDAEAKRLRTADFYARRNARLYGAVRRGQPGMVLRLPGEPDLDAGTTGRAPRPLGMRRDGAGAIVVATAAAATVVRVAAYAAAAAMPARVGSTAAVAAASSLARVAGTNMTMTMML